MTRISLIEDDIAPAFICVIREIRGLISFLVRQTNCESQAQQKSRALDSGTAPLKRDLQLVAVPYSLFVSFIIPDVVESFNTRIFLALFCRRRCLTKTPRATGADAVERCDALQPRARQPCHQATRRPLDDLEMTVVPTTHFAPARRSPDPRNRDKRSDGRPAARPRLNRRSSAPERGAKSARPLHAPA